MSEELRTEELLTNEDTQRQWLITKVILTMPIHGTGFWNIWKRKRSSLLRSKES